ncbi:uncharacterized protein ARMOST_02630 [Armillaria ostoyae]|uniref:Uncharacterized protein n=1 Tax=Armillaria ostoyae TaxID=47428 RepID=A0A284QSB1_ARMOS|nr:uncharacterized protein ARMOST_02630 [Armillaria ostoyae]
MLTGRRKGVEGYEERICKRRRFVHLRTSSRGTKHHQIHARSNGFFEYKWDDNDTSSPTRRKLEALSFLTLVKRLRHDANTINLSSDAT